MHDAFRATVLDYYYEHQRDLPWRIVADDGTIDAYHVMVSEVMLQQTQVPRVIEKYHQFLELFPTIQDLARASLEDVFMVWQGLGYNRRAKFLRNAAQLVVNDYDGVMPRTVSDLVRLPGVGHNTASAIVVYSYNEPLVFIETNIRTVYLHHFFADQEAVDDARILELVAETIDDTHPREWYWALMDYGTYVKKTFGNPNVRSKQYSKQSVFKGSKREVRGKVLRILAEAPTHTTDLIQAIQDNRLADVLSDLEREQLISNKDKIYSIAS